MLGNTDISLYRFLQETNQNKLVGYLSERNVGVREYFEERQYAEGFPIYDSMIVDQFSKARERKDLLDRSHTIMDHSNLNEFSQEVKGKITNHLENEDLRNIIEASSSAPNQNLDNPNAEQLQEPDLAR